MGKAGDLGRTAWEWIVPRARQLNIRAGLLVVASAALPAALLVGVYAFGLSNASPSADLGGSGASAASQEESTEGATDTTGGNNGANPAASGPRSSTAGPAPERGTGLLGLPVRQEPGDVGQGFDTADGATTTTAQGSGLGGSTTGGVTAPTGSTAPPSTGGPTTTAAPSTTSPSTTKPPSTTSPSTTKPPSTTSPPTTAPPTTPSTTEPPDNGDGSGVLSGLLGAVVGVI